MPPDTSASVTNSARGTLAVAWRTTELWRLSDTIRERTSFIGRLGTTDSAQGRVNWHTEAMCTLFNPPILRFIFVLIIYLFCRPKFLEMSYSSSHDGFKLWYDQQFKILTYYSLGEYGSGVTWLRQWSSGRIIRWMPTTYGDWVKFAFRKISSTLVNPQPNRFYATAYFGRFIQMFV